MTHQPGDRILLKDAQQRSEVKLPDGEVILIQEKNYTSWRMGTDSIVTSMRIQNSHGETLLIDNLEIQVEVLRVGVWTTFEEGQAVRIIGGKHSGKTGFIAKNTGSTLAIVSPERPGVTYRVKHSLVREVTAKIEFGA